MLSFQLLPTFSLSTSYFISVLSTHTLLKILQFKMIFSYPDFSFFLKIHFFLFLLDLLKSESCSVMPDSLGTHGLYSPLNSPGQNTGVVSFSFARTSFQCRDRTQVSHIAGSQVNQAGIKIARRNINNLRYADDTTRMAESE